jgi:hypothetical protein
MEIKHHLTFEKLAVILPLGAAACFACSAVYLFGEVLGFGEIGMLWLFTFTDVATTAVPMTMFVISLVLLAIALSFAVDMPLQNIRKTRENPRLSSLVGIVIVYCILIAMSVYGAISGRIPTLLCITAIIVPIPVTFAIGVWTNISERHLSSSAKTGGYVCIIALVAALAAGFSDGWIGAHSHRIIVVETTASSLPTHAAIAIDRGMVLLEPFGYTLLPWSEVKSVMHIDHPENLRGLVKATAGSHSPP